MNTGVCMLVHIYWTVKRLYFLCTVRENSTWIPISLGTDIYGTHWVGGRGVPFHVGKGCTIQLKMMLYRSTRNEAVPFN